MLMMVLPVEIGWTGGGRYLSLVVIIGMEEVFVLAADCQSQSFVCQSHKRVGVYVNSM